VRRFRDRDRNGERQLRERELLGHADRRVELLQSRHGHVLVRLLVDAPPHDTVSDPDAGSLTDSSRKKKGGLAPAG
jgi:hypothetical protein